MAVDKSLYIKIDDILLFLINKIILGKFFEQKY